MGPIKAAGKYRQEGRGYEVKDGESFFSFPFLGVLGRELSGCSKWMQVANRMVRVGDIIHFQFSE